MRARRGRSRFRTFAAAVAIAGALAGCGERGAVRAHRTWVEAVAFSPDGRRLASCDGSGLVRLWDVASSRPRGELRTDAGCVGLRFLPDGRRLLVAGALGLTVWDADAARLLATLSRAEVTLGASIKALDLSRDGRSAVSAHQETGADRLQVWDLESGRLAREIHHPRSIVAAAIDPGGRLAATSDSGLGEGTVRVFDLASGTEVWHLAAARCADALSFSPDGLKVAAADGPCAGVSSDNRVLILDAITGRAEQALAGHDGWVSSVAYAPDGRLVSGSWDGSVRVWSPGGALLSTLALHRKDVVRAVAVSPDGSLILAGGVEWRFSLTADDARWFEASWGALRLWDAGTGRLRRRFEGPE